MSDEQRDAGYDDFLDALEEGQPYYLESSSGSGYLPPRTFDPVTGDRNLKEETLDTTGEVLTKTLTQVAAPEFVDDAPYVVAIAAFGSVRITGQISAEEPDAVEIGDEVEISVEVADSTGERIVVFEPV